MVYHCFQGLISGSKFGLEEEHPSCKSNAIPQDFIKDIQQEFDRIPDRQILDFLVRCYMDLVNW